MHGHQIQVTITSSARNIATQQQQAFRWRWSHGVWTLAYSTKNRILDYALVSDATVRHASRWYSVTEAMCWFGITCYHHNIRPLKRQKLHSNKTRMHIHTAGWSASTGNNSGT